MGGAGSRRGVVITGAITSGMLLVIYLLTMPSDLSWLHWGGDGGELITAVVTRGIPHPPGYPLYLFIGRLWQWLPWGTIAWRFHLLSTVSVAAAGGILTGLLYTRGVGIRPSLSVGLLFGLSIIPWSQALTAEVYGLNLLLVALFLLVTERGLHPFAQGVVWGVALTTHITALMLFLLFRPRQNSRSQTGAQLLTFFLGSVVGLLPYVLLPLWRQPTSPVQWGTLDTVSGWWWLVTAQLYRPNAFALTPEWWLPRFMEWSDPLLTALTPLMWPLIILSLWFTGRQSSEKNHSSPAGEGGVRLLLLITTALFYLLFAFFYLPADALVLTGPAWLLLAYALVTVLQRWPNLALILPLGLLLINYPLLNSRENNNLLTEVDNALVDVPEGALLTTAGSPEIFTLWYFQHVEGQRNDLMLVDYQLFAFSWYRDRLKNQYPELSIPAADDWAQFQRDNQRRHPICTISITFPDMKEYVTATSCEDR